MKQTRKNSVQLIPACYLAIVLMGGMFMFSRLTARHNTAIPGKDVVMEVIQKRKDQTAAVGRIMLQRKEMTALAERFFPEVRAVYIQKDIIAKHESINKQADNSIDGAPGIIMKTLLKFDRMSFAARRELYHRSRNIDFLREQLEICKIGFNDKASRLEMANLLKQLKNGSQDENEEWEE